MHRIALAVVLGLLCAGAADADVRAEEKSQVKFEGMLGRMLNLFGGRATKDGITSTVAVKGDRKMTLNENSGQLIDLKEEKIYDLNVKDKSYTVTTFADLRRQMEEARRKAAEQAPRDGEPATSGEPQKQMDVDFSLKESGQTKAVNGFNAREVVMTIIVREKGKTLDANGGFVVTSNSWLTPKIQNMSDVAAFDRRYAQKLGTPMMLGAQQMAMVTAMYPMMRDALTKMQAENVNMDGTPVLTVVTFEAVANPAQAQQAAKQEEPKGLPGLGGLGGRLGRRILDRGKDDKAAAPASATNRAVVMTMQHEIMKVTPAVTDTEISIPAGYKLKT